ncbi:MAG: O-antigen ligase family protein [Anaeromyxobacter sp.]
MLCASLALLGGRPRLLLETALAVVLLGCAVAAMAARRGAPIQLLPLLALPLVSALQLIPLPPSWIALLSPSTDQLFRSSLAPLGAYPAARALSLEPAATGRGVMLGVAFVAAFWAAASFANTGRRRRLILSGLASGAALVVATMLFGALLGWTQLLAPTFPLVNANHVAGFLGLTAFAALGMALESREHRGAWLVVFAASTAAVLLSLSRGGIAAFMAGVVVFWMARRAAARRDASWSRNALLQWAIPCALVAGVAASAYLAATPIVGELRSVVAAPEDSKIRLWAPAARMVGDFPVVGIGRSAFETSFPAYKRDEAPVTYTHLENEWLQLVIELGLPGGVLFLAGVAWILARAVFARDRPPSHAALLAGVASLLIHEVADFSFELPATLVAFGVALGLLAEPERECLSQGWRRLGLAAALGACVAAGLGMAMAGRRAGAERDSTPTAGLDGTLAWSARVARWRPADYLPQARAGAHLAAAGRCPEALAWLQRAMLLAPTAAEPHRFAGRCLAALHRDPEARREYRLAVALQDPMALAEATEWWRSPVALAEVALPTPDGLMELGDLMLTREPAAAREVFRMAYDTYFEPRALGSLAVASLASGDPLGALDAARARQALPPADPQAYRVAADALERLGRPADALEEARRGAEQITGSSVLLTYLSDRARGAGRFSEAIRMAERIQPGNTREAADREFLVARALRDQGRIGEAIRRAESGVAMLSGEAGPLVFLSDLCLQAHRYDDAIQHLERATALAGRPSFQDRIQQARRAAAEAEADRRRRRLLGNPDPLLPGSGP